jgi:hypothetical protein
MGEKYEKEKRNGGKRNNGESVREKREKGRKGKEKGRNGER